MSHITGFGATVCKNYLLYTVGPLSCLSVLPCLSVMLVYCGQSVGWIKMKLSMEVGLGPGHILLDPAPKKGHSSPSNFRPMNVVAKRVDGSNATW